MTRPAAISPAIRRALAHIEACCADSLPLAALAAMCGLSLDRFSVLFRREVGVPPHRYLCQVRIRRAQALLSQGVRPAEAALEAGFFDQSHLYRHFKRQVGVTPGEFMIAAARSAGGPAHHVVD